MNPGYDYIIVEAGSAGCVLANRLTEDAGATVLLLEAGGRDNHPYIQIPLGLGKLQQHRMFDWVYDRARTASQRSPPYLFRRKVLGGSSSINVMAYTRGHRADFDRWAREGATGWSFAEALPYFKRSESSEGGKDPWRGGSGPLGTEASRDPDPLFAAFEQAGQLADGLPRLIRTAPNNGFGPVSDDPPWPPGLGGERLSETCPAPHQYDAPNACAQQQGDIAWHSGDGRRVRAQRHDGPAEAKREVILCGDIFDWPRLLMLSASSPASHLREIGVAPLIDRRRPRPADHLQ